MRNIVRAMGIMIVLVLGAFSNTGVKRYSIRKIVIDAGHGGRDSGCLGRFSQEKNIALSLALKLGELIEKHIKGVEVIYTRQTDEFITLHGRASISNKNNADLFISIHCNAELEGTNAYGTETHVMGMHTNKHNLAVAQRENSVILMEDDYLKDYQGFDPKLSESYILFSLYQNAYNEYSLKLAQNIETQFKSRVGRKSRGVKQTGFLVLWKTIAPSVLVEVGFITHPHEEQYLNSKLGQTHIASGIFRALRDYKCEIEANS